MVTVVAPPDDGKPTQGVKTLEATFAPPTAHKDEKLHALYDEYHVGLQTSFNAGADSMNAVSEHVTPLNLPYQAKAALCNYVPQLLDDDTYGAKGLQDDHPIRLTNQAAVFDHSTERDHAFTWRVPQPGHASTNFWIPLRINPEQEGHWYELIDEDSDLSAGEIRVTPTRKSWTLHVTVKYPTSDITSIPDDPTYIGLDIGETALITGCALKHGSPTDPFVHSGRNAKRLRKEMYTTLKRLQQRDADWRIEERFTYYQNSLTDQVEKDTTKVIEYAEQYSDPMLVMEDLTYIRENVDYGKFMNRRLHNWAFALLQTRIEQKAKDAGIPVLYVDAAYTSQTCHACSRIGYRPRQAEFVCPHDDCHVSVFQCDINAAANIAERANPWGESVLWKSERDDSPRDGSTSDSTARYTQERAAKGVATPIPAKGGRDDNADSSTPLGSAGTTQMTLNEPTDSESEIISKPQSNTEQ